MSAVTYDKLRSGRSSNGQIDMRRQGLHILSHCGAFVCIVLGIGCEDYREPISVRSHDPDRQIVAMKADASCHKTQDDDVAKLVDDLGSDDSAIRFYAIQGLQRITDDDFGYRYYLDEDQQPKAIARWKQWLKERK